MLGLFDVGLQLWESQIVVSCIVAYGESVDQCYTERGFHVVCV